MGAILSSSAKYWDRFNYFGNYGWSPNSHDNSDKNGSSNTVWIYQPKSQWLTKLSMRLV